MLWANKQVITVRATSFFPVRSVVRTGNVWKFGIIHQFFPIPLFTCRYVGGGREGVDMRYANLNKSV